MAVAHIVYAMIKDGEIKNLALGNYYDCSVVAHNTWGNDSIVVDVTQYPVEIGDTYEDEKFYRVVQGVKTEIERIPTEEEIVNAHTSSITEMSTTIDDILVALVETEV